MAFRNTGRPARKRKTTERYGHSALDVSALVGTKNEKELHSRTSQHFELAKQKPPPSSTAALAKQGLKEIERINESQQKVMTTGDNQKAILKCQREKVANLRGAETIERQEAQQHTELTESTIATPLAASVSKQVPQEKKPINKRQQKVLADKEKRKARLEYIRKKVASLRAAETFEQREARLQERREYNRMRRANETREERKKRLEYAMCRNALKRATETPEQRHVRLEYQRLKNRLRKPKTPEEHEEQLRLQRERNARRIATETPEQKEARLEYHRNRVAKKRENETPEQREARLKYQRERAAAVKAAKMAERRTHMIDTSYMSAITKDAVIISPLEVVSATYFTPDTLEH